MNLVEQRQTAAQLMDLWKALMPDLEVPGESQFLVWAGGDPIEVISMGINRAAGKRLATFSDKPMDQTAVVRYASGVMRNVRNDLKAQRNAALQNGGNKQ